MAKRQIGQSEAIYRVLPELHLKKTNVRSIFVSSGFPKNISHFLKKINDDDDKANDMNSGDDEEGEDDEIIKLEDRLGNFKQSVSIQDKYKARPKNPDGN